MSDEKREQLDQLATAYGGSRWVEQGGSRESNVKVPAVGTYDAFHRSDWKRLDRADAFRKDTWVCSPCGFQKRSCYCRHCNCPRTTIRKRNPEELTPLQRRCVGVYLWGPRYKEAGDMLNESIRALSRGDYLASAMLLQRVEASILAEGHLSSLNRIAALASVLEGRILTKDQARSALKHAAKKFGCDAKQLRGQVLVGIGDMANGIVRLASRKGVRLQGFNNKIVGILQAASL